MTMRKEYTQEMETLHNNMIRIGSLVEKSMDQARETLENYDDDLAIKVIANDDVIDQLVLEVTHECILLIAKQQPVASDLRDIIANLKLATDFERMADNAEDVCVNVRYMISSGYRLPLPKDMIRMFEEAKTMARVAMDAYVTRDREKAMQVLKRDDVVDQLYELTLNQLVQAMKDDSKSINGYLSLVMVAKHVERFADHAENVAEWVIYYLEGALDVKVQE
ncbi:MAG: phosphate signaling complex protein PhoU [Eubacteriales bacterium]|nr:phosphate signaling complex protein PhoU [Eubacteriales bacterium]